MSCPFVPASIQNTREIPSQNGNLSMIKMKAEASKLCDSLLRHR